MFALFLSMNGLTRPDTPYPTENLIQSAKAIASNAWHAKCSVQLLQLKSPSPHKGNLFL
jgi:hypothetical protein